MNDDDITKETVLANLEKIRRYNGEAEYLKARESIAQLLLSQPGGEALLSELFPDLDIAGVKPQNALDEDEMLRVIRSQVPSVRSQAQLRIYHLASQAFHLTMESLFSGADSSDPRGALEEAFTAAAQSHLLQQQVAEIPEDDRSEDMRSLVVDVD